MLFRDVGLRGCFCFFEVFYLVYESFEFCLQCRVLLTVVGYAYDRHFAAVGAYLSCDGGYDICWHASERSDADGTCGTVAVHLNHFSGA